MKHPQLNGTGVALVTPFKNGVIDYAALENIIEHVIEGGVDFLVSLGTTGEAVTLSAKECQEVIDFTVKTTNERVPIVAGHFGDNYTAQLTERIKATNLDGVTAIMSCSPPYVKPSQEGIYRHFMEIAKASPLPIILYNVPGRTACNIDPETVLRLAKASELFIGVKEAAGDLVQLSQMVKILPDNFYIWSGDDPTAIGAMSCGAHGVISVIANVFPKEFSDMIRAANEGDFAKAKELHLQLLDVHPWLYVEGNPTGIKAALEIEGFCNREVRTPLAELSDANYAELKKALVLEKGE